MKKILLSMLTISAVAAVAFYGTRAFFSDTETSTNNIFQAGQVDLKVGNTSYYNGAKSDLTTWELGDLTNQLFFNFLDVKPGDTGEDTIELKVVDNPSWVCATLTMDANDENVRNNPEEKANDVADDTSDDFDGELAQNLHFVWWPDDGDNVLETDEAPMAYYMWDKLSNLVGDDNVLELTIADSKLNFFTGARPGTPLDGNTSYYIGKAWCMGDMTLEPVAEGQGDNPMVASGVKCNGANVDNMSQTDLVKGTLQFYAEQSRHNEQFLCPEHQPITVTSATMNFSSTGWAGWSCPADHPKIVSGTTNCTDPTMLNSLAWKPGATVGSSTYPTTPFGYTYAAGEEGWIVQNGGTPQSCNIILTCGK